MKKKTNLKYGYSLCLRGKFFILPVRVLPASQDWTLCSHSVFDSSSLSHNRVNTGLHLTGRTPHVGFQTENNMMACLPTFFGICL